MITCGLPKLDAITGTMTNAEIVIRLHPQWRDLYSGLSNEFAVEARSERSYLDVPPL